VIKKPDILNIGHWNLFRSIRN